LIITTGSEPLIPDISGIKLDGVITSDEALELTEPPESLTIIGAGAIGMEFATLYNSLGSKVTVVELQERIIPDEDQEITAELLKIMKRQGIKFKLAAKALGISKAPNGLETHVQVEGKEESLLTEKVLVAVGRKLEGVSPDITALGLEVTKGAIHVNNCMATNVAGVYAAGDVIGGSLLAHLAFAEGRVAAKNAMGMQSKLLQGRARLCLYDSRSCLSGFE